MADLFLGDLRTQTAWLESLDAPMPAPRVEQRQAFKH